MFRSNLMLKVLKIARYNPNLKPSLGKIAEASIFKPNTYIFQTNTLKNKMSEYIDLKENTLCGNEGSKKKKKRLGRGRSSGCGKSSGHGNKGQGHRRNKKKWGFEGGQTPLSRRLPKFGVPKQNLKKLDYLNIQRILYFLRRDWISSSPEKYITIKDLVDSGLISNARWGVKLLSRGGSILLKSKIPIFIEVTDVSKQAFDLIKASGGNVRIRYFTRLKLKEHLKPELFDLPLAEPLPPQSKIIKLEKYREMGCDVEYNIPNWVKDEMEKGRQFSESREKRSFTELVDQTKVRVKKTLPRQYNFSF